MRRRLASKSAVFIFVFSAVMLTGFVDYSLGSQRSTAKPQRADKISFDVDSVKQDTQDIHVIQPTSNFLPELLPNGGFLRATNFPLSNLINFAYNLTPNQYRLLQSQAPHWISSERFDVEARTEDANATADQIRLMMQSLLAERFSLVAHFDTNQLPVYALKLAKPGKTGPQLRPFPDDWKCAAAPPGVSDVGRNGPPRVEIVGGMFPAFCGAFAGRTFWPLNPSAPGALRVGARNVTMETILNVLASYSKAGRPLVDQTGLTGNFDIAIEFTSSAPSAANPYTQAETFEEALRDQLGLKLEPAVASMRVFVIDHIEEPTPN